MAKLSYFLFPFSWLYGWVMRVRNFLYDIGWKKSHSCSCAVIGVGNLNVGGTGKTPMIEYVVTLLQSQYTIAILSRGYGRSTHGFLLAEMHDDATTIGDEPFQFYKKYNDRVVVAVCESRVEGIHKLLKKKPGLQVILLDDSFQHRAVRPLHSILLTDFSKPFFNDQVLPMGRLREPRSGSKRADVVVVTKCSSLSSEEESAFTKAVQLHAGTKPIFFSGIQYKTPVPIEGNTTVGKDIVLVTGIANSKPLEDYAAAHYNLLHHFKFADHHVYSLSEIQSIESKAGQSKAVVLTTEKDMVKLIGLPIDKKNWVYLPIETHFLKRGSEFDKLVTAKIQQHLKAVNPKI